MKNNATPPREKWSASAALVDTVVYEELSVSRGWWVVMAVDERARYGVP